MQDKKAVLKEKFSKDFEKYYKVKLFQKMGFKRKKCNCGNFFWTLDENRKTCPNQPCQTYEFIGKGTKNIDYYTTWKTIEKFFVKNDHASIPSYPTVCRWFPGLYFTVASIVAFQRSYAGKTVFELPKNPLIIPQSCMRFNDIPNVGVTGRHFTNFVMIGQHALYNEKKPKEGYWKDRCIELDFQMLTQALKIKPEDIVFVEDVWVGPNAFGYSLEYFVHGLEVGNAVFTEFLGTADNYAKMDYKIIDMGAGLERFTWLLKGTSTCYDAVFGPVIEKLKKKIDFDKEFLTSYFREAGKVDLEEMEYYSAKRKIAAALNMDVDKLVEKTGPLEAAYAIADHSKTVLQAVTDGALPSNVGGGYNIRVVLRRALNFIDEFKIDADIFEMCKMHANYLKKMNPRLTQSLGELKEIIDVEKKRFDQSKTKARGIALNLIQKNIEIDADKMRELYESHGVTPELLEKISKEEKIKIKVPKDFYKNMSSVEKIKEEKNIDLDLSGIPETRKLFYEDRHRKDFTAKVLKIIDKKYVILDQTVFYGRSGGQEPDTGLINNCRVYDVERAGGVIIHLVENPNFKEGETVRGIIDWKRRERIAKHHTAIHVINGSARKVLGNHIWQAGAHKSDKKAHIDITHYESLTSEQVDSIEKVANDAVRKNMKIKKHVMPRIDAERIFGMRIYQGGAIPEKVLRINEISGFDVEACSGTHLDSTGEIGKIAIVSSERIQDGIIRFTIVAGDAAEEYFEQKKDIFNQITKILGVDKTEVEKAAEDLFDKWKESRKTMEKSSDTQAEEIAKDLETKIENDVLVYRIDGVDSRMLQKISKILSTNTRIILLFGVLEKIYIFGSAGIKTEFNVGELVKKASEKLGGRGGGTQYLGQGIGTNKEALDGVIDEMRHGLHGRN